MLSQSHSDIDTDTDRSTPTTTETSSSSSSSSSECEPTQKPQSEDEIEPDVEEEQPLLPHVLSLMQRNTIQFNSLYQIKNKWERSPTQVKLTHAIESFRDAIMIPVNDKIVIFYMQHGFISQAQHLTIETATMENITLPVDIDCANLALFCLLNDTIYCFARTNQQVFHR